MVLGKCTLLPELATDLVAAWLYPELNDLLTCSSLVIVGILPFTVCERINDGGLLIGCVVADDALLLSCDLPLTAS